MRSPKEHLDTLSRFPILFECFENYVAWVCEHCDDNLANYDLIRVLEDKDSVALLELDKRLAQAREILGITLKDFCRLFGFNDDLLAPEPEKIHDILAEPYFVLDLAAQSFSSIKKLPHSIVTDGKKTPVCDFTALLGTEKFAIEVKTIRIESWAEDGKLLGNASKPYWWGDMFKSNVITKIEDKKHRVLKQLSNAKQHFRCTKQMLAIYSRRLGPSTLMTPANYSKELEAIQQLYPSLDYLACKDYGGVLVFYPAIQNVS